MVNLASSRPQFQYVSGVVSSGVLTDTIRTWGMSGWELVCYAPWHTQTYGGGHSKTTIYHITFRGHPYSTRPNGAVLSDG